MKSGVWIKIVPDAHGKFRLVTLMGHPLGARLQKSATPLPSGKTSDLTTAEAVKAFERWEENLTRQNK